MPVLDDLRDFEARVISRIRELEGAVVELDELRAVAKRLGLDTRPAAKPRRARKAQPRRRSAAKPKPKPTAKAASNGATAKAVAKARAKRSAPARNGSGRRDDILRIVKASPGITVREIGKQLGVDRTGLYPAVNKLQAEGALKRKDGKLTPTAR